MSDNLYALLRDHGDLIRHPALLGQEESKAELMTKATTDEIVRSERPALVFGLGLIILALAWHRHADAKRAEAAKAAGVDSVVNIQGGRYGLG